MKICQCLLVMLQPGVFIMMVSLQIKEDGILSEPQGIEVRQTLFATDNPELENVIFLRYSILNTGSLLRFWTQFISECGRMLMLEMQLMTWLDVILFFNQAFIMPMVPTGQYGDNPPSFFTTFLAGPNCQTNNSHDTAYNYLGELIGIEEIPSAKNLKMSSHVFFIGGDPDLRDPSNATEARNYLQGKIKNWFLSKSLHISLL
jgi:hypothetical protein